MIVQMTQEEFDSRIKAAKATGHDNAMRELHQEFMEAHNDLTKNFWSRVGKEANIEFCRRMINILAKRINK